MKLEDLMALLGQIEDRLPVDEWRVGSVHVWPILRVSLAWHLDDVGIGRRKRLESRGLLASRLQQLSGSLKGAAGLVRPHIYDRRNNDRIHFADAIFLGDGVSKALVDGRWYDRICHPLIEELQLQGFETLLLEPGNTRLLPRFGPSRFIQASVDRIRMGGRLASRDESELVAPDFAGLATLLDGHGVPTWLTDRRNIVRQARTTMSMAAWFERMLDRVNARIGFLVDLTMPSMALNLACRRQGIPSVELQHGTQGSLHPFYAGWSKVPKLGYEFLPTLYWNWDSTSAAVINAWSEGCDIHSAIWGGNPWAEEWLVDSAMVQEHDDLVKRHLGTGGILVSLQTGLVGEDQLAGLFQVVKTSGKEALWWFRLHPTMRKQERAEVTDVLSQAGISLNSTMHASTLPLNALLRNAAVHITHSSAVVLEAERFQVPSIVTSDVGAQLYARQLEQGKVVRCWNPEEILESITRLLSTQSHRRLPEPDNRWKQRLVSLMSKSGSRR